MPTTLLLCLALAIAAIGYVIWSRKKARAQAAADQLAAASNSGGGGGPTEPA